MHKRLLVIASMVTMLATAGTAQADLIAGWDFSQYFVAGRLTLDGTSYVNTLSANYGDGSGTMFVDGTAGSTNVDPTPTTASAVIPAPRVVGRASHASTADYTGAVTGGGSLLPSRPEFLGLLAGSASTVVFQASPVAEGKNWEVSFGGETLSGAGNVTVSIDTNCDGANEATGSPIALGTDTGADTQTESFLDGLTTQACFQFAMDAGTVIDNVAIEAVPVPEPAMVLGLAAGAGMLAWMHRRRA